MYYHNSKQYLDRFENLQNGFYEYRVDNTVVNLYTIFEDRSGWICTTVVDWNNNLHCTEAAVDNVKPHDYVINQLRTDQEYNVMAVAEVFKRPFNEWLRYPHIMYVHNSMKEYSSTRITSEIENSNMISFDLNQPPTRVGHSARTIGFGNGQVGDTVFGFGGIDSDGFFQSFSGSGRGLVYVR